MSWQTRMRVREESRTSVGRILCKPDVPDGERPDAPIQITIFFRLFFHFFQLCTLNVYSPNNYCVCTMKSESEIRGFVLKMLQT